MIRLFYWLPAVVLTTGTTIAQPYWDPLPGLMNCREFR